MLTWCKLSRKTKANDKTYIAKGSPATFEQTLEDGSPINLQANEIRYEPAKNIVVISGHALYYAKKAVK